MMGIGKRAVSEAQSLVNLVALLKGLQVTQRNLLHWALVLRDIPERIETEAEENLKQMQKRRRGRVSSIDSKSESKLLGASCTRGKRCGARRARVKAFKE